MKIGVFTVCMPEYTPVQCLQKLKEFGYDGAEWRVVEDKGDPSKPGFWSGNRTSMSAQQIIERAGELKDRAKALGVAMPSLAAYIQSEDQAVVDLHLKATAAIGARNVRISAGAYKADGGPYLQQLKVAREIYARVADAARKHGVRAVIETHMGLLTPDTYSARYVLEGLDPKHVGIMYDPANEVYEGGQTYPIAISTAGEYLAEVHVKNIRFARGDMVKGQQLWKMEWCPLNEGLVNWPAVIEELTKSKYDGWLMIEDFSSVVPIDQRLKGNIAFLKSLM
jgi:sugar phosphate isomerase/epimerase